MQLMINSIEGTQLGRGYIWSYESPWVPGYCDLVGWWDVLHGYSIRCRTVVSAWQKVDPWDVGRAIILLMLLPRPDALV